MVSQFRNDYPSVHQRYGERRTVQVAWAAPLEQMTTPQLDGSGFNHGSTAQDAAACKTYLFRSSLAHVLAAGHCRRVCMGINENSNTSSSSSENNEVFQVTVHDERRLLQNCSALGGFVAI